MKCLRAVFIVDASEYKYCLSYTYDSNESHKQGWLKERKSITCF